MLAEHTLVLAIDTASPSPAVALAVGPEVFEEALASDRRSSEELLPAIQSVLARAGRALTDCDRFAVCAGPGSFTGLRIGLATAWGLSRAIGRPVESVSTLEAMAEACRAPGLAEVLVALDAGRGEAAAALYDLSGSRASVRGAIERVPLAEIRALAPQSTLAALPDGWLVGSLTPLLSPARALALAVARSKREQAGTPTPIYSRQSAAEEKRGPAPA